MNGGTLQKQVNKLTNYGDSERSNHSNHTNASNPKLIPTKKIVKRIETDNTLLRSKTAIHEKHIEVSRAIRKDSSERFLLTFPSKVSGE